MSQHAANLARTVWPNNFKMLPFVALEMTIGNVSESER